MTREPYRLFLVDDHAVFRAGVRAEMVAAADMVVVGEAGGVAESIAGINATKPDVVLLDVHMPDGGGVAVLRGISRDAVRRVAGGDAVFSPRLAGFVLDSFTGRSPIPEPALDPELDSLTPRELEVLRLLARGYTYREIAQELVISIKTVETHASNVLRKTQQSNRNALTRWAIRRQDD